MWAIGAEDRLLYFRSGVSHTDPTGKTWKLMAAVTQLSRASSDVSLWSSLAGPPLGPHTRHNSTSSHSHSAVRT